MNRYFRDPSDDVANPIYPCGICAKTVARSHRAIQCDLCNFWNHIKCDGVEPSTYNKLKSTNDCSLYYCKTCKEEIFAFQTLSNDQYLTSVLNDVEINKDLNLNITPPPELKILFNDIEQTGDDNLINCNYYDFSTPIPNLQKNNKSMFHLNIASLGLHKDELVTALSLIDLKFDVIAVTETKIKKGILPIYDPGIPGYEMRQTPTESDKGGALLYIRDNIDFKRRTDLEKICYKPKNLESVFIEVINKNKKNTIFACIYRHPSMKIEDFTENFLSKLLSKLKSENKTYLLGDFNIDLLKVENDPDVSKYYNLMTANLFVPHITLPTRITSRSKTLIDNIFSNDPAFANGTSGNFTFSISDHLPQFLLIPNDINPRPPKKHNLQKRDLKNLDKASLVADFIAVDWKILSVERMDPNYSFEKLDTIVNKIIDKHAPPQKIE